jgi:hypothetical protein
VSRSFEVDGDEVEALLALLQIAARVLVPYLGPGVVERALMHLRQVRLAELDHLAVDVDHDGPGDGRVPENLPEGGALAPADHQGTLGCRVGGEQARVDQGLVVNELIALAGLDPPVEHQGLAVGRRLQDLDVLELGLRLHDRLRDGMHMPLEGGRGLDEPLAGLRADQLTGTALLLTTGTAELRNIPRCISTIDVRSAANCSTR